MEHFGGMKNPANERPRKYVDVAPRTAPEAMVVTDKEATNTLLLMSFPFVKSHDEVVIGDYRANMVRNLALQILNQRLSDLSQGSNPPFPFANVSFLNLIHGYEALNAVALFGNDGPEKALNALTAELMKAEKFGFTESELEIAKKDMMSGMEKTYNERTTTESKNYVDEYIRAFLDKEPFPGIANEYNYYKSMLPGITVSDVNAVMKKLMVSHNTFSLIMAPDKKDVKLPSEKELLAMTVNGFAQDIKQDEEKKVATSLMDKKPAPGKVIATQKEDGFGATTYTLSNGVKVTIKPTDFKSDEILMTGVKQGGTNSYGLGDRSNVHFCTEVTDAMGVGEFTPADLSKVLSGKEIKARVSLGDIDDNVSASSTVKDFESMLQLVYLTLTEPRKDEGLFKAYKDKTMTMMQFMTSNPQFAFIDTVVKTLYNNDPLAGIVIPKKADFDAVNLDRLLQIYKNEFSLADGYHFFIVGNISPDVAVPLIETYLGSLHSTGKKAVFADAKVKPVKGVHDLRIKKGKEKKSYIQAFYMGEMPFSEEMAMDVKAIAEVLNIKVIEELREKMSAIYTGGFNGSLSKEPYSHYSIGLRLPCGPENVQKLLTASAAEINNLKQKGPDVKDLDKVKNQWKEKYKTEVKENKYWASELEMVLFWGRDKDRVLHYESYIDKLTPAEIQQAAQKVFDGKNKFIAVLDPES